MADLTGVFNATNITKGQDNEVTLSKVNLESTIAGIGSGDLYFEDQANWKQVKAVYLTDEGKQVNELIFDASLASPLGNFNPSSLARDTWEIKAIIIFDFDGGFLKINRGDLTVADFDIIFNVVATTQSAFDPSVSSQSNLTFSNANRTVSSDSFSPPYAISLSQATTTASSKIFASFQCGTATGQSQININFSSVAPSGGSFSSPNLASIDLQFIDLNNANVYWIDTTGGSSGVSLGTFPVIASGDLVDLAVDLGLSKLYIRVNGVWQNGEAGVSGGYDIPAPYLTNYIGQPVYKRIGVESGEEYTLPETPVNVPSGYELV